MSELERDGRMIEDCGSQYPNLSGGVGQAAAAS